MNSLLYLTSAIDGYCSTLSVEVWLMVCVSNGENLSVCRSFRSARVGMVTEFLSVVRTEKVLGLWKGVSPVSIFLLSLSLSLCLSLTHTHTLTHFIESMTVKSIALPLRRNNYICQNDTFNMFKLEPGSAQ